MSDGAKNLAGPNPSYVDPRPPPPTEEKRTILIVALAVCFGFAVLCVAVCVVLWKKRYGRRRSSLRSSKGSSLMPQDLCRHFYLWEIRSATRDFDKELMIGRGGFGNVYKGIIDGDDSKPVAVKRLNPGSTQGAAEFVTEIEMLSKLRHNHLASLIGYCNEDGEMILVYEYVANGTLRDHLYGPNHEPLPWTMRLKVCVGAARGLHYLDTGAKKETPVAVKVIKPTTSQGLKEFWTEVETVSKLRNPNLVSLIGYCDDQRSRIIVYNYMAHGTLGDHLYRVKKKDQPLDWNRTLEIIVGAARGLAYLHAAAEHGIIHRDVKTSNILLDENFVAKVSDFGLSRLGPESPSRSHVSSEVKGTFGYLDPDYFDKGRITYII